MLWYIIITVIIIHQPSAASRSFCCRWCWKAV